MKNLLFVCLCLPILSYSQINYDTKSQYALVYKLTNEQAYDVINDRFDAIILSKPIDTIANSLYHQPDFQPQEVGHFLVVAVKEMNVAYYYSARHNFAFIFNKNDDRMKFQLIDSTGNFIEADEVRIKDEKVKFDKELQEYSCNGFEGEKLIEVDYQGFTGYYSATREDFDNWRKRQKDKYRSWKKRRYATYYAQKPGYRHPLPRRKKKEPFYKKPPAYGYITTNKPKYLPNDTVKIKAYLVHPNKKPYTKPLTIKITSSDFKTNKSIKKNK